jgi:hypothetical protein
MGEALEDLLPEIDRDFLTEKGYAFTASRDGGNVNVVIKDFPFPGYAPPSADLLIILPAGYPNANVDMFFTIPDVKLASGAWPKACEAHPTHGGRAWQQWSRHIGDNWRQGVDNLRTYITTIKREIAKGI